MNSTSLASSNTSSALTLLLLDSSDHPTGTALGVFSILLQLTAVFPISPATTTAIWALQDCQLMSFLYPALLRRIDFRPGGVLPTSLQVSTPPATLVKTGFITAVSWWDVERTWDTANPAPLGRLGGTLLILLLSTVGLSGILLTLIVLSPLSAERNRQRLGLEKSIGKSNTMYSLSDIHRARRMLRYPSMLWRIGLVLYPSLLVEGWSSLVVGFTRDSLHGEVFFGGAALVLAIVIIILTVLFSHRWNELHFFEYRWSDFCVRGDAKDMTVLMLNPTARRGRPEAPTRGLSPSLGGSRGSLESPFVNHRDVASVADDDWKNRKRAGWSEDPGVRLFQSLVDTFVPAGFWSDAHGATQLAKHRDNSPLAVLAWEPFYDAWCGSRTLLTAYYLLRPLVFGFFVAVDAISFDTAVVNLGTLLFLHSCLLAVVRPFRLRFMNFLSVVQGVLVGCYYLASAGDNSLLITPGDAEPLLIAIVVVAALQVFLIAGVAWLERIWYLQKEIKFRKRALHPIRINVSGKYDDDPNLWREPLLPESNGFEAPTSALVTTAWRNDPSRVDYRRLYDATAAELKAIRQPSEDQTVVGGVGRGLTSIKAESSRASSATRLTSKPEGPETEEVVELSITSDNHPLLQTPYGTATATAEPMMSPILRRDQTTNYSSIRDDFHFNRSTFDDEEPPLSFVLRPVPEDHERHSPSIPSIVAAQPRNPLFSTLREGGLSSSQQTTRFVDDEKGWSFVSRKYDENPYLRRLLQAPVSKALEDKKHKERMKAVDRLLDGMGSPYVFEDATRERMEKAATAAASPSRRSGNSSGLFVAPGLPDDDLDGDSVEGEIHPYVQKQPKHRRRV